MDNDSYFLLKINSLHDGIQKLVLNKILRLIVNKL